MEFLEMQEAVAALIGAHPTFAALAATTIFEDLGDAQDLGEQALADADRGYCVKVWPPVRASAQDEAAGVAGADVAIVVRFEVSPVKLAAIKAAHDLDPGNPAKPKAAKWLTTRIRDIIGAVIDAEPPAGGVRYQLTSDAFEMVNFDDGLVAYHIRFAKFNVFER